MRRAIMRVMHGFSDTVEYSTYWKMLRRCYNPSDRSYRRYGERGIKVCKRWLPENNGVINFIKDMGKRPQGDYSIDRINNNKGYSPKNCRWATRSQQMLNRNAYVRINKTGVIKICDTCNKNFYAFNHKKESQNYCNVKCYAKYMKKNIVPPNQTKYHSAYIEGYKNNLLTFVKKLGKSMVLCKCDCGNSAKIYGYRFATGHTKSCGCLPMARNKPIKDKKIERRA